MSKAGKRRMCPAVQREIGAAECGENRNSKYSCPVDCAYNPFAPAQYDNFLEIERSAIQKSLDWFRDWSTDFSEKLRQMESLASKPSVERQAWQIAEFFSKRDAKGQTCAEAWAAAGFPGLKNDERFLQMRVNQSHPKLIEVRRVIDDARIEVVDLLEPGSKPFLLFDRSLAARVCRFTALLS
jgi:hypothetical protein